MGLAQNLFEGFANAAGDTGTVNRIENEKADQKALAHEELQNKSMQLFDAMHALQQRRLSLDPKSPTYNKDTQAIDEAMAHGQKQFTDLYHPEQNPGALAHLGGFLRQHMLKRKGIVPASPQQAKASFEDIIGNMNKIGATPVPPVNPVLVKKQQIQEAYPGITDEDLQRVGLGDKKSDAWKARGKPYQDHEDGKFYQEFTNAAGDVTREEVQGYQAPASTGRPKTGWSKDKHGKFFSVMLDNQNQPIPGTENYNVLPPAGLSGRISTGQYHWVDDQGAEHEEQTTRYSGPASAGVPNIPTTPAGAKDKILGYKRTADQNKASNDVVEATKLSKIADLVAQHPDDALNQKRLAVALERASAGRFTTQALDYIKQIGWGATIEQWANNPSTGALPARLVEQLVRGAHQNLEGAKTARDAAFQHGDTPPAASSTSKPSGKAVSLKAARNLPAMKGKTDDEIRKAIEAAGHQVIP